MNFSVVLLQSVATVEHLEADVTRNLTHEVLSLHMLSKVILVFNFILALCTLPHLKSCLICARDHFLDDLGLDCRVVQQHISYHVKILIANISIQIY